MNQQNIPTAAIQFTEDQIEVIECGLQDFLAGLGKRDPVRLAEIASCGDWTRLAKAETERRFAELLTRLPLNEVQAIANQQVDLTAVADYVKERLADDAEMEAAGI